MSEPRSRARLDTPRETRRPPLVRRPSYDSDAFGSFAEQFARFMGTAKFLIYMTLFVIVWMLWNTLAPVDWRFDEFPFIFLTLMLSLQASYAAPLILLAQNRQEYFLRSELKGLYADIEELSRSDEDDDRDQPPAG
jgi:uncharacterized membrane protein